MANPMRVKIHGDYTNINMRSQYAKNDKAKCEECERIYHDWKFIGKDGRCYRCHDIVVDLNDQTALIQFIAENR
jgi:hypothetical protein